MLGIRYGLNSNFCNGMGMDRIAALIMRCELLLVYRCLFKSFWAGIHSIFYTFVLLIEMFDEGISKAL